MSESVVAAKEPKVMELKPATYYWCACGKSINQPFCDGSHGEGDIVPQPFTITETKTVALCQCKKSRNPPYCDGSHAEL